MPTAACDHARALDSRFLLRSFSPAPPRLPPWPMSRACGSISTAPRTLTFARTSHNDERASQALGFGAVAVNAMLYPRVLMATAVLNLSLLPYVVPYLALPAVITLAMTWIGAGRSDGEALARQRVANPLQLSTTLQMAAAILGLTDVDALTISMARHAAPAMSLHTAALAIAVGVLSNTALTLTIALFVGSLGFRRVAGGTLLGVVLAAGVSVAVKSYLSGR